MRKPKVKNKYNLTPTMIRHLNVNREKLGPPLFWRNEAIKAWCISLSTAKSKDDDLYGYYDSFWLGVYDEDSPTYTGKIRFYFSSYGDMCDYKITKFYKESEIENIIDLEIQEKALKTLNNLIDKGVFYFDR